MKRITVLLLVGSSFALNGLVSDVLDTAADVVHGATDTARDIKDDTLRIFEPRRPRTVLIETSPQQEVIEEVSEPVDMQPN